MLQTRIETPRLNPAAVRAVSAQAGLPRIVALGGGTGLAVLLKGLRNAYRSSGAALMHERERLTAIVTAADDGGSSGALRRAFRILAPGDIRNCLLALSDADPTMQALFDYRFDEQLERHSLGNLMITALALLEKDFPRAVERAGELLAVRGRVLPATAEYVQLQAEFDDGSRVTGESSIAAVRRPIRRISLRPTAARALPAARHALAEADLVVIGPGSLYTSLIPTLLVDDLADAIAWSRAQVVLVMNLMTEPGETDGYAAEDVLLALRQHAPQVGIHHVLINAAPIPAPLLAHYAGQGAEPLQATLEAIETFGCEVTARSLLAAGPKVRHEPHKLAQAVLEVAAGRPV